jgi:hypothetical protein
MHTPYDDQGIPVSAGIPPIVRITGAILLVLIFALLTMVFLDSSSNHVWPAANSATLPLSKTK